MIKNKNVIFAIITLFVIFCFILFSWILFDIKSELKDIKNNHKLSSLEKEVVELKKILLLYSEKSKKESKISNNPFKW